jgi:hypothetical protein
MDRRNLELVDLEQRLEMYSRLFDTQAQNEERPPDVENKVGVHSKIENDLANRLSQERRDLNREKRNQYLTA